MPDTGRPGQPRGPIVNETGWMRSILFGVESLSEKILKAMNKKTSPRTAVQNINLTLETGIQASASLIIGFPGEDLETILKTADHCRNIHPEADLHVSPVMLLPGSQLYARALKEGFDEDYWLSEHPEFLPGYPGQKYLPNAWTSSSD